MLLCEWKEGRVTLLSSLPFSFLSLPLPCPREQKKKRSTLVVTEKGGVCSPVMEWFVFFFKTKTHACCSMWHQQRCTATVKHIQKATTLVLSQQLTTSLRTSLCWCVFYMSLIFFSASFLPLFFDLFSVFFLYSVTSV